ncbi:hypothetical protein TNCV_1649371, partial [Trichonephila clavipes]
MENTHRRPSNKRVLRKEDLEEPNHEGAETGKVLDREVLSSFCKGCDSYKGKCLCALAERDNRRIFTSRQRLLESSFEGRRAKKIKKSKEIELFQEQG